MTYPGLSEAGSRLLEENRRFIEDVEKYILSERELDDAEQEELDKARRIIANLEEHVRLASMTPEEQHEYFDRKDELEWQESQRSPASEETPPPKPIKHRWYRLPTVYFVQDGKLWMHQTLQKFCIASMGYIRDERRVPAPARVNYPGKGYVSATIVAHYLMTGQWVKRVPVSAAKRFQGRVRINGRQVSLGYFATREERDCAVGLARLGVFPENRS